MPTINQLVREGRTRAVKKSTSPALLKGLNSIKEVLLKQSTSEEGVCTSVKAVTLRNQTQLLEK